VHSIGVFTGRGHEYLMAILTEDDPSMLSGVTSIQRVARVVHRDIVTPAPVTARAVEPGLIDQTPDEWLP
jgi:hypothetical protein